MGELRLLSTSSTALLLTPTSSVNRHGVEFGPPIDGGSWLIYMRCGYNWPIQITIFAQQAGGYFSP